MGVRGKGAALPRRQGKEWKECASTSPSIGRVAGFTVYVYWPDHAVGHFHLRKSGREVSVSLGGEVLAGSLSGTELRDVLEWLETRSGAIAKAIDDLKHGRAPQWVD